MKPFLIACAVVAGMATGTTVLGNAMAQYVDDSRAELLANHCQAGVPGSCEELVRITGGQCAGPEWSGCRFGLAIVK